MTTTEEPVVSRFIQIADGLAILLEMQRIYSDARRRDVGYANVEIDWQSLSPYVVDNGAVKILPLARSAGGQEADERIGAVGSSLRIACIHFFGGDWVHSETLIDPESGYGKKLSLTDLVIFPREVWDVGAYAFALVHAVDPDDPEASTLSLHFHPREWRWSLQLNAHTKQAESQRRTWQRQLDDASIEWRWPEDATAGKSE